jgi:hypothetical protein
MADAEAICEAVTRPTMRIVPIKAPDQQSILIVHRTQELLVRQRIMLVNALRAHLAEFGIVARVGRNGLEKLLEVIADDQDERVPPEMIHLGHGPHSSTALRRARKFGCSADTSAQTTRCKGVGELSWRHPTVRDSGEENTGSVFSGVNNQIIIPSNLGGWAVTLGNLRY